MASYQEKICKRIVIIGAGLSGLATSIGLRKKGFEVIILDKATQLREIGAGIQLASNAGRVLANWGLLDELAGLSIKPESFTYHSWTGRTLSVADLNPAYEEELGIPYFLIHRVALQQFLLRKARQLGVYIRLGCSVANIDFENSAIIIKGGETLKADLIIGADGDQSFSRRLLEGSSHKDLVQDSRNHVYRATVTRSTLLKEAPEVASLVTPYSLHLWTGPGAHIVLYPLHYQDQMNIVWIREYQHEEQEQFITQPQEIPAQDFHAKFQAWDQRIHRITDIAGIHWKRTLIHVKECESWTSTSGRFVLIGDAAHAFPPYMAQAGAMAIEDAACLSTLLGSIESLSHLPNLIRLFEKIRIPRVREVRRMTEACGKLYHLPDGSEQQVRDNILLYGEPGWPNFLSDPVIKADLYGYDVIKETERILGVWKNGALPSLPLEKSTLVPFRVPASHTNNIQSGMKQQLSQWSSSRRQLRDICKL